MSLKIISTFGDHSSLYPLATKDIVNSLGMTAYSYKEGGKDKESKLIDAKDRFIDEFGTQAIWLGGLPFFKWAFDKSVYKMKKLNPGVDIRLLADKDQLDVAKKYAKDFSKNLKKPEILKSITDAEKNSKLFKGLFFGKFAAATVLTLASYFTLTVLKQRYTDKQITNRELKKLAQEEQYKKHIHQSPTFKAFSSVNGAEQSQKASKPTNNPSFKGGLVHTLQGFMFNPVHNMFIVDAGITSERLYMGRTKHEKMEYAIKEGGLLFFMYVAGKYVQKGIESFSEKVLKKPIKLHVEFLTSDALKKSMTDKTVSEHISKFNDALAKAEIANNKKPIFEFLYNNNNAENLIVKAAKKSGLLKVLDESNTPKPGVLKQFINNFKISTKPEIGKVDPNQFIDLDEIKNLPKEIQKFVNAQKKSNKSVEAFLKEAKHYKVGSVVANIGLSCLFLGVIIPHLMKIYKEKYYGEGSHIQDSAKQRLQMNFKGKVA